MTTATSSFIWSVSSAAATKVWIDAANSLLTTVGLVRTTDTGQLDTTTIVSTPAANSTIGYHVYKFPDTLQATTPIIIRLNYSVNASSLLRINIDVGATTNGAGTVAVPLLAMAAAANPASPPATAIPSYACYIDGTFTMVLGHNFQAGNFSNNSVAALVVDRARDNTGTALAAGFLAESPAFSQATSSQSRSLYGAGSPATSSAFIPALIPSRNAVGSADGTNINVFRHYMMVPGVRPSLGALSYFTGELAALTPITVPVLGTNHTYLPMGPSMTHWSAAITPDTTHCCAIRWE